MSSPTSKEVAAMLATGKPLTPFEEDQLDLFLTSIPTLSSWIRTGGQNPYFDHLEFGSAQGNILPHEGVIIRNDNDQTSTNNVDLLLTFDETDSFTKEFGIKFSPATSPTKVIIKGIPNKSIFFIQMFVYFTGNATGVRRCGIRINQGTFGALMQVAPAGASQTVVNASFIRIISSVADELEFSAFQTSGGDLAINSAHVAVFRLK